MAGCQMHLSRHCQAGGAAALAKQQQQAFAGTGKQVHSMAERAAAEATRTRCPPARCRRLMRNPFLRSHNMVSYGSGKPSVHSRQAVHALQDLTGPPLGNRVQQPTS